MSVRFPSDCQWGWTVAGSELMRSGLASVADAEDAAAVIVANQDAAVGGHQHAHGPGPGAGALHKPAQELLLPDRLAGFEVDADHVVPAAGVAGLLNRTTVKRDQRV